MIPVVCVPCSDTSVVCWGGRTLPSTSADQHNVLKVGMRAAARVDYSYLDAGAALSVLGVDAHRFVPPASPARLGLGDRQAIDGAPRHRSFAEHDPESSVWNRLHEPTWIPGGTVH